MWDGDMKGFTFAFPMWAKWFLGLQGALGRWLRTSTPSVYEGKEYLVLQNEKVWPTDRQWLCMQKGTWAVGFKAENEHVDPWLGQDPSVLHPVSLFSLINTGERKKRIYTDSNKGVISPLVNKPFDLCFTDVFGNQSDLLQLKLPHGANTLTHICSHHQWHMREWQRECHVHPQPIEGNLITAEAD